MDTQMRLVLVQERELLLGLEILSNLSTYHQARRRMRSVVNQNPEPQTLKPKTFTLRPPRSPPHRGFSALL
jgi:hypothetical protein